MMDYSLEVCSVDRPVLEAAFHLNAKKLRICEIMSGGFTVKIQQCVKNVRRFLVTFLLCYNFCNLASKIFNQLFKAWEIMNRNKRLDRSFFKAVQRLA